MSETERSESYNDGVSVIETVSEASISRPPSQEVLEEIKRNELITKVKIIAFDSLGKDPLTNGSLLSSKDKTKVIRKMEEILTLTEEEINNLFNEVCTDKIFVIDRDYTAFPVYDN